MDKEFQGWWDRHGQGAYFGGLTESIQLKNVAWQAWCAARARQATTSEQLRVVADGGEGEWDGPIQCEGYPPDWMHAMIHLNPETGEMHSDGDHRVRHWLESRLQNK